MYIYIYIHGLNNACTYVIIYFILIRVCCAEFLYTICLTTQFICENKTAQLCELQVVWATSIFFSNLFLDFSVFSCSVIAVYSACIFSTMGDRKKRAALCCVIATVLLREENQGRKSAANARARIGSYNEMFCLAIVICRISCKKQGNLPISKNYLQMDNNSF